MSEKRPYTANWVNKLTAWIRRLPMPSWVSYLIFFVVYAAIFGYFSRRLAGVLPESGLSAFDIYDILSGPIMVTAILALYQHFEGEVGLAIEESKSLLGLLKEKMEKLSYEFAVFPAIPFLVFSIVFFLVGTAAALDEYRFTEVGFRHIPLLMDFGMGSVFLFTFALLLGRFILKIRNLFSELVNLDLYDLSSIYELPSVAAKAGLFYLPIWYVNLAFNLETAISAPIFLAVTSFASLIPMAAFLYPFGALSRRLAVQKKEEIAKVSLQLKQAYGQVSKDIDKGRLAKMADMQAAISNLNSHKDFLDSISAWPWKQGTFRLTLTAVFLPIVVWLMQQILDRVLGL